MPRLQVQSRPLAWPRVVVLALVGISAAGCADSARFDSSSYDAGRPAPPQNVARPLRRQRHSPMAASRRSRCRHRASRRPFRPRPNYSYNAQSAARIGKTLRILTSPARLRRRRQSPASHGHWTWDGGSPVTVGYGETVDSIARKHHVPVAALMQTNGIREAGQIRPGQRLVIPRYVSGGSQTAAAPARLRRVAPAAMFTSFSTAIRS